MAYKARFPALERLADGEWVAFAAAPQPKHEAQRCTPAGRSGPAGADRVARRMQSA